MPYTVKQTDCCAQPEGCGGWYVAVRRLSSSVCLLPPRTQNRHSLRRRLPVPPQSETRTSHSRRSCYVAFCGACALGGLVDEIVAVDPSSAYLQECCGNACLSLMAYSAIPYGAWSRSVGVIFSRKLSCSVGFIVGPMKV